LLASIGVKPGRFAPPRRLALARDEGPERARQQPAEGIEDRHRGNIAQDHKIGARQDRVDIRVKRVEQYRTHAPDERPRRKRRPPPLGGVGISAALLLLLLLLLLWLHKNNIGVRPRSIILREIVV